LTFNPRHNTSHSFDNNTTNEGDMTMKGKIYSDDRCRVCGGKFTHYEPRGMWCPDHPQEMPTRFRVHFGRGPSKRFKDYDRAIRCLTGWRYETDQGKFDPRDYTRKNPLGFANQVDAWLKTKADKSERYRRNLKNWMQRGVELWGADRNVKSIKYADLEDLVMGYDASGKTKHDMIATYKQFFTWLNKREDIPVPSMPEVSYKLGERKIITIQQQQDIINEVKRICPNPRIWIGIKWLSIYVAIRPAEMWSLKENQINVDGYFVLPGANTKEGKIKLVPMLDADIDLYKTFPQALPQLHFFRRHRGKGVTAPGEQISKRAFYRWWVRACNNLEITGVDLYGGTRHTTTSAVSEYFSMDEMQRDGTQHGSNKAFQRYCRTGSVPKRTIYEKVAELQGGVTRFDKTVLRD